MSIIRSGRSEERVEERTSNQSKTVKTRRNKSELYKSIKDIKKNGTNVMLKEQQVISVQPQCGRLNNQAPELDANHETK